jgi:hypothetical protein
MRFRIALLIGFLPCLRDAAHAQSQWTTRVDSVPGVINDMLWTGSLALAVDEQGNILSSSRGADWTTRDSGGPPWQSVIRTGNGRYLASSWAGEQAVSEDGLHWVRSPQAASIRSATALGTKTLGSDGSLDSGYLYLSLDGTSWKRVGADSQGVSPVRNQISGLASNGQIAVAVGSHWVDGVSGSGSGLSAVTSNGVNWSFRPSQGFRNAFRVCWAKDRFFALHLDVLASSFDGLIWSPAANLPPSAFPFDVAWTGKQFITVGASGLILASDDGSHWQDAQSPFDISVIFSSAAWTGSRLILAGSNHGSRFIVTTDRDALAIRPGRTFQNPGSRWEREGAWIVGRPPSDGAGGKVRLFDMRGLPIRDLTYAAGSAQVRMPISGLGRGTYILRTEEGGARVSSSISILR